MNNYILIREMSDNKLYVIELENNKIFLHLSPPIWEHFLFHECIVFYDFVKKNRPIQVLKIIDLEDVLQINYYVKYYMRYYGIDNVRGGNYIEEILPENVLKVLEKEINTTFSDYENNIELFENIIKKDQYQELNTEYISELKKLKEQLDKKKEFVSILFNKEKYEEITDFNFFNNIIKDLEWLCEKIINKNDIYENYYNQNKLENITSNNIKKIPKYVDTEEKIRYKEILKKIDKLINTYFNINLENLSKYLTTYLRMKVENVKRYEDDSFLYVHLKKPMFILDYFFLHPHFISNWENYTKISEEVINEYFYMAYFIKNLVDELQYDICRYDSNFEKKVKYTMNYIELLDNERSSV